jgi:hypothetical protein
MLSKTNSRHYHKRLQIASRLPIKILKKFRVTGFGLRLKVKGRFSIGAKDESGSHRQKFMSRIYEKPFMVEICAMDRMPSANEVTNPMGRQLTGCRIGFKRRRQ